MSSFWHYLFPIERNYSLNYRFVLQMTRAVVNSNVLNLTNQVLPLTRKEIVLDMISLSLLTLQ